MPSLHLCQALLLYCFEAALRCNELVKTAVPDVTGSEPGPASVGRCYNTTWRRPQRAALRSMTSWFTLRCPDITKHCLTLPPRRALLYYYFAAAGNDSFAQLALGYRHAHGLGVPKSCQTAVRRSGLALESCPLCASWSRYTRAHRRRHAAVAPRLVANALPNRHPGSRRRPAHVLAQVLYYNPVAEQVVELARFPNSLPQVRHFFSVQVQFRFTPRLNRHAAGL